MSELTTRNFEFNVNDEENIIEGMPIVFESPTVIGDNWFTEVISRDAISADTLKDVAFFYNHDLNTKPLARTRNGKLQLEVKPDGVHMRASINRERSDANDLYLAIKDGDIDGMSFMFRVEEDEWEGLDTDLPTRTIKKINYVQEVSAVNYPAYDSTTISARSSLDKRALDNAREKLDSFKDEVDEKRDELELLKIKTLIL